MLLDQAEFVDNHYEFLDNNELESKEEKIACEKLINLYTDIHDRFYGKDSKVIPADPRFEFKLGNSTLVLKGPKNEFDVELDGKLVCSIIDEKEFGGYTIYTASYDLLHILVK